MNDFDEAVRAGTLEVDGKVVVKTPTEWLKQNRAATEEGRTARAEDDAAGAKLAGEDAGVELNVSKVALEPVWYLPGRLSFSTQRHHIVVLMMMSSSYRYRRTIPNQ